MMFFVRLERLLFANAPILSGTVNETSKASRYKVWSLCNILIKSYKFLDNAANC